MRMLLKDYIQSKYEIYKLNLEKAKLMALLAGYSHDLGHTPFGHDGELAINEAFKRYQEKVDEDIERINRKYTATYIKTVYERLVGKNCALSQDEKNGLEQRLRKILKAIKLKINEITTEQGVQIIHAANRQRAEEALTDEVFRGDLEKGRSVRRRLNFGNTENGDGARE